MPAASGVPNWSPPKQYPSPTLIIVSLQMSTCVLSMARSLAGNCMFNLATWSRVIKRHKRNRIVSLGGCQRRQSWRKKSNIEQDEQDFYFSFHRKVADRLCLKINGSVMTEAKEVGWRRWRDAFAKNSSPASFGVEVVEGQSWKLEGREFESLWEPRV